ncbi:hypothetical protein M5D96_006237, partial [Drosophila gunungcola]
VVPLYVFSLCLSFGFAKLFGIFAALLKLLCAPYMYAYRFAWLTSLNGSAGSGTTNTIHHSPSEK